MNDETNGCPLVTATIWDGVDTLISICRAHTAPVGPATYFVRKGQIHLAKAQWADRKKEEYSMLLEQRAREREAEAKAAAAASRARAARAMGLEEGEQVASSGLVRNASCIAPSSTHELRGCP